MTDPSERTGHWAAVHLFHQGDQDTLLCEAVDPAVVDLARRGLAGDHFFLRYWEGGPHLRVRVWCPGPPDAARGTAERLADRWNGWLAAHPSPRNVDEEEYLRFAREAAAREALPGFEPFADLHDRAVVREYVPEHARYGDGGSLAAVERHFAEASRSATALLATRPGPAERLSAGYAVLLLTWAVVAPDPVRRGEVLRAGADAWRTMLGSAYDAESYDRAYERARDGLVRRAAALLGAGRAAEPVAGQVDEPVAGRAGEPRTGSAAAPAAGRADGPGVSARRPAPGTEPGALSGWHRSVTRLHTALAALEATGEFTPDLAALRDDPSLLTLPDARAALTANRCAHLMCNRLGLFAEQEAMLRHFAARASTEPEVAGAGRPVR